MMDSIGCNCCNIVVNILSEQDGSPLKLDVFNNNNVRFFKEVSKNQPNIFIFIYSIHSIIQSKVI